MKQFRQINEQGFSITVILLSLVILGIVVASFFLGRITNPPTNTVSYLPTVSSSQPESTPSATPIPDNGLPITEKTVSFSRVGDKVYLLYKGKIFTVDNDHGEPQESSPQGSDKYSWYGLINAPDKVGDYDEIFSFKQIPTSNNFIFVMRWSKSMEDGKVQWDFPVYYFDSRVVANIKKVVSFTWPQEKEPPVPKIDQISNDQNYVSFDMYSCWNCGAGKPEKLILSLKDGTTKRIGKISYFKFTDSGKYEYKDYVVISCADLTGPGECSKDPKDLPLKTGQF